MRVIGSVALILALSACSGWVPANRAEQPQPVMTRAAEPVAAAPATAPAAAPVSASPRAPALPPPQPGAPPAATAQSGLVAPGVSAPPPPRPVRRSGDEDIVVPGVQEQQVPPPAEDPRSTAQRMADIRSWDTCVMRLQGRAESNTRPQLDTPEDVCRRQLGMSSRLAVPDSRRP